MPVSPHIRGFYQIVQQKNPEQNSKVGTKIQACVHDGKAQKQNFKCVIQLSKFKAEV